MHGMHGLQRLFNGSLTCVADASSLKQFIGEDGHGDPIFGGVLFFGFFNFVIIYL